MGLSPILGKDKSVFLFLSFFYISFVCLLVCVWRGGCKAVIVGLSPMLSSFFLLFLHFFVRLMVCVWGGGLARQAVIMGLSPMPGKDKSVFLFLSSLVGWLVCLCVCVERG